MNPGISAKIYTLEIYLLYLACVRISYVSLHYHSHSCNYAFSVEDLHKAGIGHCYFALATDSAAWQPLTIMRRLVLWRTAY